MRRPRRLRDHVADSDQASADPRLPWNNNEKPGTYERYPTGLLTLGCGWH
ncbi:MAG: hypothetical protein ACM3ML_13815 [Micromonosporaceae bacterium]